MLKMMRTILLLVLLSIAMNVEAQEYYQPHRVWDANAQSWTDFESMLAASAGVDAVFLGEQHDDPVTHRLQLAFLQGVSRRRPQVALAMEMFERDTQPVLDAYLQGALSETEFLAQARPWGNYSTDYRPMLEWARARKLPVIASNAPRRLARLVATHGIAILEELEAEDRRLLADETSHPQDDYFKKFAEVMGGTQNPHGGSQVLERVYQAQCLKDDTMAESIAALLKASARPLVVHINGDFHSAFGLGAAARVRSRVPQVRLKIVSFVPVPNLDSIETAKYERQGDFIVFTLR